MAESTNPVLRAVDLHSGSKEEFAAAVGVSRVTVYNWIKQGYVLHTDHAYGIERVVRGRVTMQDLAKPWRRNAA